MKATTSDEKFIVTLYQQALESGELEKAFNRYEVGTKAALQPRGVNAICKLLLQANFIKKSGEEEIYLTKNGVDLAIKLLET